jgi:hypothetical protein
MRISRFVLRWIHPTSARDLFRIHCISGFIKATFVRPSPRRSSTSEYSPFWLHFTRDDGHYPLHVDLPPNLRIGFQSPESFPDRESRRPPPLTRAVLPVLTYFTFKGVSDYLEYFVARVDAPRLEQFHVTFFNESIFDTPQLIQFIHLSEDKDGNNTAISEPYFPARLVTNCRDVYSKM